MNLTIVLCVVLAVSSLGATASAEEGYEILFKGTSSKLSKQEKKQIFDKLGFRLSEDKKFLVDDTCGEDVSPTVEVTELNGVNSQEVFVNWGNTCTSGVAGQSITLFIKNSKGKFMKNLGFPGTYRKLNLKSNDYPDLLIISPGFCHGVWYWTGTEYKYKCSQEEQQGACISNGIMTVCN